QDPRPIAGDPLEPHQTANLLDLRLIGASHRTGALIVPVADLAVHQLPALELPEDSVLELFRDRLTVPLSQQGQSSHQLGIDQDAQAHSRQQALDPIAVPGPLGLQIDQATVELAPVFGFRAGDVDRAPDLAVSQMPADQHGHQLGRVETIGLGAPLSAVDLDAGGVHHEIADALVGEVAMEPEAVAAGLIATDNPSILAEAEALLGLSDFDGQARKAPSRDGPQPRLLTQADGEGEL